MAPLSALLWRQLRVHQIYGANTDVGKTIVSTVLCSTASKAYPDQRTAYLKPVSTGPDSDSDSSHIETFAPSIASKTLFQYGVPCSPYVAAKISGLEIPSDASLRAAIHQHASAQAALGPGWLFIETAGGVHSPGPSGTSQVELYSPLRTPIVLVGDSRLGGISQTIAAYESLKLRGLDVEAVMLFHNAIYENHLYLGDYFRDQAAIPVQTVSTPPDRQSNLKADRAALSDYYDRESSGEAASAILEALDRRHQTRIARLEGMSETASNTIWYPFTQQKLLTPDRISAIDSANGDHFQVLTPTVTGDEPLLQPAFDGSASWWTQGLGHGNPRLTLAAAYAAGRYGHVMFAEAVHEPALALAETLVAGMQSPRLSRVFYTDNGSTGCEVAVKMALRSARKRYGWAAGDQIEILGLRGSYHGDTIGTMDCSEPSVFNEKVEWYRGRGFWFDFPTVWCRDGEWVVDVPEALRERLGSEEVLSSLEDVFDLDARSKTAIQEAYKEYFKEVLGALVKDGRKFGALMLEPVVLGAGGMMLADPLFQKTLVEVVRENPDLFGTSIEPSSTAGENAWAGLPVVFDEVFTGLYRLGRFTSSSFIDTHADISVHAKLLTGGLLPLCATLASESIFEAFSSDDKSDALLHGHSYTAHAVGCQVALESLQEMQSMEREGAWDWAKTESKTTKASLKQHTQQSPWSVWSPSFVDGLSRQTERVAGVWALGSVLAISMRADDGVGYNSKAAARCQVLLREGTGSWNVHSRVLGNVLYIMTGQKTDRETVARLEALLSDAVLS
ncbi:hypothetical protein F5X68DRAFT_209378 [Plectosphaerella plurivora]|uniref:Dethiobiotin synthase n=1 Tax=Plectosphaerella plurivora TaxID=936078 RepID=A0A9P8V8A1_9PEZI|nr:hypothetical protein F5X68DRAFT_209378 [Plectosphaerella plurivora]